MIPVKMSLTEKEIDVCLILADTNKYEERQKKYKQYAKQAAKVIPAIAYDHLPHLNKKILYFKGKPVEQITYTTDSSGINTIVNFKQLISFCSVRQSNVSRLLKKYTTPDEKVIFNRCLWLTRKGCKRLYDELIQKIDGCKSTVLYGPYTADFICFLESSILS